MNGPLAGCRVVVCRAVEQSHDLLDALARAGAVPVRFPLIEVVPPQDGGAALDRAVARLGRYSWVLLTSANAVAALRRVVGDRPWPPGPMVATVGPATTTAAHEAGIPVALARSGGTGLDLAAQLPAPPPGGGSVLMPVAELAGPEAVEHLARAGWDVERVTAYRTVAPSHPPELASAARGADAVLFTSPSTVDRYLEALGGSVPPIVVCIGPTTTARAERRGVAVAAVADDQSDAGLVAALTRCWTSLPSPGPASLPSPGPASPSPGGRRLER